MRRIVKLILGSLLVLGLLSCGGGGGEPDHSPAISNLRYSQAAAVQASGGTASIDVLVDFTDTGADVASARMTSSAGADLTIPVSGMSGTTNGTVSAPFVVSIDKAGKYTFDVWLEDGRGGASNRLSGAFEVLPRDTTYHPPMVSGLKYAPATAVRSANGTVSINASLDFADTGADVASLRLTTSAGADLTVPLGALNGLSSGTAAGMFVVSTDVAGKYTFEAWLVDSAGTESNRLSGTFEVLASDTTYHPPSIANLRYSPTEAFQAASDPVQIGFTVDYADTGGDIASARVAISTGAELALPTPMAGSKSGSFSSSFAVQVATVGKYTFEISFVDDRGSVSNRLAGAYEVLPTGQAATWAKVSVTPPAELLSVGLGGGQYVAVGRLGAVMTSPDLVDWTVRPSGVSHALRSVAMSASRIVAVGDNTAGEAVVISSVDGAAWSVQYNSSNCQGGACASPTQLSRVIWTGTQFIAVGMERPVGSAMVYALVLTSPDGVTWTKRAPRALSISDEWSHPNQRWITSIAWSGSLLVLPSIDNNWEPVVWTSSDAETWTLGRDLTNDVVWSMPFVDVTWGNGRFVAVDGPAFGGDSPMFTSVDGFRWQPDTTIPNLPMMNAVTSKPGEFVAVGASYLQTSPDGLQWTVSPLKGCGNDVLWDGTRYVAVGTSICKSQ